MPNVSAAHPLAPVTLNDELEETKQFYRAVMDVLSANNIPFLLGGAYSLAHYADIKRHTKDLDLFVLPEDRERILKTLSGAGFKTEITFEHWLGKVFGQDDDTFVDLIYSSGNGVCRVDANWFRYSVPARVLDRDVRLCPPEETIWSKAYILERERYDGADIAHMFRSMGPKLDWPRLLDRFGPHWRLLLSHIILFGFVYPDLKNNIPQSVMLNLLDGVRQETLAEQPARDCCMGSLLSRGQYRHDIELWGYRDARLKPQGALSSQDVEHIFKMFGEIEGPKA